MKQGLHLGKSNFDYTEKRHEIFHLMHNRYDNPLGCFSLPSRQGEFVLVRGFNPFTLF